MNRLSKFDKSYRLVAILQPTFHKFIVIILFHRILKYVIKIKNDILLIIYLEVPHEIIL